MESAKIVPAPLPLLEDENEQIKIAAAEAPADFGAQANAALPKLKTLHKQLSGFQGNKIAIAIASIEIMLNRQEQR